MDLALSSESPGTQSMYWMQSLHLFTPEYASVHIDAMQSTGRALKSAASSHIFISVLSDPPTQMLSPSNSKRILIGLYCPQLQSVHSRGSYAATRASVRCSSVVKYSSIGW